jgi:hypothetical protein
MAENKKVTEAQIAHEIIRDAVFQNALKAADDAQAEVTMAQHALEMMRQRKDMLMLLEKIGL